MDTEALAAPVSSLVELTFVLLRVNRPWNIRTWTEVSDGVDTAVASVAQEASTVQPVTQNDPGSSSCLRNMGYEVTGIIICRLI